MSTKEKRVFQKVYPFATENVASHLERLNLEGKDVITVGSSLDQAYNALVLGTKHVTVFDINANTEKYHLLKSNKILETPREKLYNEIIKDQTIPYEKDIFDKKKIVTINNYLQSNEKYKKLRKKLKKELISFVNGDIFNMDRTIENKKFDCMILSNILQYLESFSPKDGEAQFLRKCFDQWKSHLNDNGVMQLLYLYNFGISDIKKQHSLYTYNLENVVQSLKGNSLNIEFINGIEGKTDAIVTYTKK